MGTRVSFKFKRLLEERRLTRIKPDRKLVSLACYTMAYCALNNTIRRLTEEIEVCVVDLCIILFLSFANSLIKMAQ